MTDATNIASLDDLRFMDEALAEARLAAGEGEVPIGAVVVIDGRIVGRGRNAREHLQDPTAHAEVLALQDTARALGRWRLSGATVYATLEPCPMCAGALVNARVDRLVFGIEDPKAGATGTLFDIARDARLNHRLDVRRGVRAEECAELLKRFFREKRKKGSEA
jgi:tRNA(adenine34) deaminase